MSTERSRDNFQIDIGGVKNETKPTNRENTRNMEGETKRGRKDGGEREEGIRRKYK